MKKDGRRGMERKRREEREVYVQSLLFVVTQNRAAMD